MRPTYGAELLAEVLGDTDVIGVLEMKPPEGLVLRDVLGNVYDVVIRERASQAENGSAA